jgi:hypothetical protein
VKEDFTLLIKENQMRVLRTPVRFTINWIALLTAPLWAGIMLWAFFARDVYEKNSSAKEVMKGQRLLWD